MTYMFSFWRSQRSDSFSSLSKGQAVTHDMVSKCPSETQAVFCPPHKLVFLLLSFHAMKNMSRHLFLLWHTSKILNSNAEDRNSLWRYKCPLREWMWTGLTFLDLIGHTHTSVHTYMHMYVKLSVLGLFTLYSCSSKRLRSLSPWPAALFPQHKADGFKNNPLSLLSFTRRHHGLLSFLWTLHEHKYTVYEHVHKHVSL